MQHCIKVLVFLFIMTFVFWLLIVLKAVEAEELTPYQDIKAVDGAVLHIVQKGIPQHEIKPWPNHPIVKNVEERKELVEGIVAASRRWAIPQMFLVAMAFREGSFRNDNVGDLEEKSTFQMVDQVISNLKCDVSTFAGAADCASQWLYIKRAACAQSLKGGFVQYATGRPENLSSRHEKVKMDGLGQVRHRGKAREAREAREADSYEDGISTFEGVTTAERFA